MCVAPERGEVGSLWVKAKAKEDAEASRYPERTLDPVLKFRVSWHGESLGTWENIFAYLSKREIDPCLEGSGTQLASMSAV